MAVKKFFKDLGTQEDIGDRDEDYGDAYLDDEPRNRRKGDRRRDADGNDEYYEPSRSESRRRAAEEDYDDYYDEPRRTERRYTDERTTRRGEDRYGDRYDDHYDARNEPDDAYDSDAEYYEPRRGRLRPNVGGRGVGAVARYAVKKEPTVQCFLPDTYMECREELVNALKEGNVVVVDVRKLEAAAMMRLLDFMSGAGQALDADMYRLDDSTMIVLSREDVELDIEDLQARMEDDEETDEETDEALLNEEELLDDESDDPEIEDDEL